MDFVCLIGQFKPGIGLSQDGHLWTCRDNLQSPEKLLEWWRTLYPTRNQQHGYLQIDLDGKPYQLDNLILETFGVTPSQTT